MPNLTQLLPPSLANYVDATIGQLSEALAGSNEFLAAKGFSPTVLYSTLACAALVVPLGMSRWSSSREGLSPFASQMGGQDPVITDEDFSYITSEDLEQSLQSPARTYDPKGKQPPADVDIEDDILLIKSKGVTYPNNFPPYSIGEGRLLVQDVRDRVGLVMGISERRSRRVKMLYKGRHLKDSDAPINGYGVKNNSEILIVIPEGKLSDDDSSESVEDVVTDPNGDQTKSKKKRNKRKKKDRSPRDSAANLDVPGSGAEGRRSSAEDSRHPSRVPSPAAQSGPIGQLQTIGSHFRTKFVPLCDEFSANPPKDRKKCEDEHRKLSETIMQQILLKLDEVETGGDPEIRAKRKELVSQVQDVLKGIDEHLPEGVTRPTY
ncbi:BAG domain-containing protein [Pseudomassariella vexata]|uniref:BAG domain-domain-containing protein n=1 Tax=Pseudomassariella vexata TaxID=1141098 RepID=A0A1Y2EHA9_9PEZI|nr:BAG domain-containing protein [Pseudomassariella vexata]ORY70950.1 BAG domain-domain-containing protein [Pseudomassariella vexata]